MKAGKSNWPSSSRLQFSDSQLRNAGVQPGDPSLYQNPLEGQ